MTQMNRCPSAWMGLWWKLGLREFRFQRAEHGLEITLLHPVLPTFHAPVRPRTPDGVCVVGPDAITMDQRALTRAVDEVLNRGDRDDGLGRHSNSAPMALVLSAEPLR